MRLAAFVLCAWAAWGQGMPTDLIPPHSRMVIGMDLRRIIDSAQLPDLESDNKSLAALMLAQNGLSGMNPLKDVDSLLIAITGDGQTPPVLTILRGRFHGLKLGEQKNPKGVVALLDDSTMLAGDEAEVHAALARRGGTPALRAAEAAHLASMAARYDLWGTGDKMEGMDGIDRLEFGATFHEGFVLNAEVHVKSPADAKKVADALKFFTPGPSSPKFSLHSENGTLKLSMAISKEELQKAIAQQKASMAWTVKAQAKVDTKGKIVTNAAGDTVSVTLPGGH